MKATLYANECLSDKLEKLAERLQKDLILDQIFLN